MSKTMTVKELITHLKAFNPQADVMVIAPAVLKDGGYLKICDAEAEFSNLVTLGCEEQDNEEEVK